ncbi:CDP-alcohol phosphatidyltransferase family protein [Candidatus Nesciobacter abundans]|uniref:Phosphatidylcholine/phosphatidylserine synthase n=1 Tax=Candidatus Nesciobacter abundans TaxID=2601668 RepID=A0A5C0UHJ3_9PROT|nr:phosphatidylcholine/phosphatidylserine synthase [Candidatus Nesciobacter abundans]QEK39033.1 phosphatidylcholine/phosphatidylserine synthase [Candidatus Nesciobacter abundans]
MNQRIKKYRKKLFINKGINYIANIVTSLSICLSLKAIKLSYNGKVNEAVILIIICAFIDGIDGKIARYLKSDSEFGKTLDSLADFLSFGIAPILIIFFYKTHNWLNLGWSIGVFFSLCMAFRLARFSDKSFSNCEPYDTNTSKEKHSETFEGIPAPAGGLLLFMPIVVENVLQIKLNHWVFCINTLLISMGLISKIRTIAINKIKLNKSQYHIFFGILSLLSTLVFAYIWIASLIIGSAYILYVITLLIKDNSKNKKLPN